VSIAVKDASGPYDLQMRRRLVELAQAADIPYNLDVYVNYSSDGSVALRAGFDVRVGLIGPGLMVRTPTSVPILMLLLTQRV